MTTRPTWPLLAAAALLSALATHPQAAHAEVAVSGGRYVMGTVLEATVYAPDRGAAEALLEIAFTEAARLDAMMTTYNDRSALMRLNRAAGEGAQRVPPELAELLAMSVRYSQITRGTFDVSVGPLLSLWRSAGASPVSAAAFARAHTLVGSDKIRVGVDSMVELARAGMAVDLGGIAKGYALDRIGGLLSRRGVKRAYLSFGQSSIRAFGAPPDALGWRIALREPAGGFAGTIALRDRALSVSSSFGGARDAPVAHIVDPRSGRPLERDLEACVLAQSAAEAEAFSKALLILGEREGIALIERQPGAAAILLDSDGRGWMSAAWPAATRFERIERASVSSK